ncbi:IS110 family transposase [Rhodococcus sp. D-6]|uniref:IS110 family transposase n=1 Tax=Rhodococcus sp. D-6 TaxID=1387842 RepID=A0AAU7V133_9NOCA|nr:IS110 family transposase [Rhodococcus sp. HS-D2]
MFTERTSVGLDVHARSVAAAAIDSVTGEVLQTKLTPSYDHIRSWIAQLPGPAAVTYEAGPTGFGLYRYLTEASIRCVVAAPSKLHKPAGDRVKTDARDALHLARLLRLDEVTSVSIPSVGQEAARDLVRAREDCRGDLMRARHRLSKLLLRRGIVYYGGQAWSGAHDRWLRTEAAPQLTSPATRMAFDADYDHVLTMQARRRRLDVAIEEMAVASELTPVVRRMCCLRGVSTLTGFGLAVEIGDWTRFTGNTIGSFVGLVPSEYSSGSSRAQGSITKTGNSHARRLLVEAAWHHRARYHVGAVMRSRWDLAPAAARARGDEGNRRLHGRWVGFLERRKRPVVANAAIARELAGWCWSLAVMDC